MRRRFSDARTVFFWIAIATAFLLRLPALAEPIGIDQGIFSTAGWGLSQGLVLYRDLWDQKPPGIYLTYWLAFALLGRGAATVVWLDILASSATVVCVYGVGRTLMGHRAGAIAAAIFAMGTIPAARYPLGGFLYRSVPEAFSSAFIAGAVWCVAAAQPSGGRHRRPLFVFAGLLIGIAIVYKPNSIIYLGALFLGLFLMWTSNVVRAGALMIAGAVLAPLIAVFWLSWHEAARDAWVAIVKYNVAYVGIGNGAWVLLDRLAHEVWWRIKSDPVWMLGTTGFLVAGARWRGRGTAPGHWLLGGAWLAAAVCAVGVNGIRMYDTYFSAALPALALLAACWVGLPRSWRPITALALLLTATLAWRGHYFERAWTMTQADVAALRGTGRPRSEYLERFGGYANGRGYSARANEELADYVRQHTQTGERVYIFGMAPVVYFASGRLAANRFLWTYPTVSHLVTEPDFSLEHLASALAQAKPRLLILEQNNRDSLTGWRIEDEYRKPPVQTLLSAYEPATVIEDFTVYRLKD